MQKKILFFGKKGDKYCQEALTYLSTHAEVKAYLSDWGDKWPKDLEHWSGDIIISYLSRWIIPASLLEKARLASINFHPAPPEYPGIGCVNFALYDGSKTYGATCHHMASTVDTGNIVAVRRFDVEPSDNVETLLDKTYQHQYKLFQDMLNLILNDCSLPHSNECWTRAPFTRKQLNELSVITPDMPKTEIERRVRATSFKNFQPAIKLHGHVFRYELTPTY